MLHKFPINPFVVLKKEFQYNLSDTEPASKAVLRQLEKFKNEVPLADLIAIKSVLAKLPELEDRICNLPERERRRKEIWNLASDEQIISQNIMLVFLPLLRMEPFLRDHWWSEVAKVPMLDIEKVELSKFYQLQLKLPLALAKTSDVFAHEDFRRFVDRAIEVATEAAFAKGGSLNLSRVQLLEFYNYKFGPEHGQESNYLCMP